MGDVHYLAKRRELFVDERGHGLQLSWTPEAGLVVVSVWHGDRCVGTVRLPVEEAARAAAFLMTAVSDYLTPPAAGSAATMAAGSAPAVPAPIGPNLAGPGLASVTGSADEPSPPESDTPLN